MVMIPDMPAVGRGFIEDLTIPPINDTYWTTPVAPKKRRVAIVSSAAVSLSLIHI